jgi:hypothetical protein
LAASGEGVSGITLPFPAPQADKTMCYQNLATIRKM